METSCHAYVQANAQAIVADIKRLVDIQSIKRTAAPGAPYGEGIRAAQLEAMRMCGQAGMEVTDCDGRIAYAHYGDTRNFIAVIAHLDVVPAGDGWDSDPFDLTERDGYLVGRGTGDDKGPFVLALYAVKYIIENNIPLNYGIRLIIGLDEESGMSDIAYYNAHCAQPRFTFTPDAAFPVGHGEKGIYEANLISKPVADRMILELRGGAASNIVADSASAVVRQEAREALRQAAVSRAGIALEPRTDGILVRAQGVAKHAGQPQGGINANDILLRFLLERGVLTGDEKRAAAFLCEAMQSTGGEQFGIACDDGVFTPLTIIGGMLSLEQNRFVLNVNCRYPTAITPEQLEQKINAVCAKNDFTARVIMNSAPYYLDPDTPAVRLLCGIYNELTHSDEKPYVMSGGTYARHMDNAVSYGVEFPQADDPSWVGAAHMKNEAISVAHALQACEIFINTLVKLQSIAL